MNAVSANALTSLPTVLFMDGEPVTAPAGGGAFQLVVMVFLVLLALFFIFILPAKSRDKQTRKLLDSLKINDKVLTMGGIIGVVCSIDQKGGEIVLRVDDSNNVKIRFALSSVYYVFNKDADKKEQKDKSAKK